ncbi:MAG: hypothetical protein VYD05_12435, partial [Planctomycetota bacterium]|nr:hypothetical protein [Planctomycetota bacterium]
MTPVPRFLEEALPAAGVRLADPVPDQGGLLLRPAVWPPSPSCLAPARCPEEEPVEEQEQLPA